MDEAVIDPRDARIAALDAENKNLKMQLLAVQRGFLLQQRELNVLQMEKLDANEKALQEPQA